MSYAIAPIPMVAKYFGNDGYAIITSEFRPGKGWYRTGFKKRVSRAWVRKLKDQGVTNLALTVPDERYQRGERTADFTVAELLKIDRRPLLGGNII